MFGSRKYYGKEKNGKENYVLKFWMTWKIRGGKYKGKW